jgi:hypothetical protein
MCQGQAMQTHTKDKQYESLSWEASTVMFGNHTLLKQLATVLGFGALSVFCLIVGLEFVERNLTFELLMRFAGIGMAIFLGLILLSVLSILLFYGNRYQYHYIVDESGVKAVTTGRTRIQNRVINLLLLVSGRPQAMGAGMLAQARQSQTVSWEEFDHLSTNRKKGEILLHKGRRVVMVIQCLPENYDQALLRLKAGISVE